MSGRAKGDWAPSRHSSNHVCLSCKQVGFVICNFSGYFGDSFVSLCPILRVVLTKVSCFFDKLGLTTMTSRICRYQYSLTRPKRYGKLKFATISDFSPRKLAKTHQNQSQILPDTLDMLLFL